jgi:hypothetical protein
LKTNHLATLALTVETFKPKRWNLDGFQH